MNQKIKFYYNQISDKFTVKKPWDMIIIFVLNVLIAIPILIFTIPYYTLKREGSQPKNFPLINQ